jgi:hypothetical protein
MTQIYTGIDDKTKKPIKLYAGVSDRAKLIYGAGADAKLYTGVNDKTKLIADNTGIKQ